MWPSLGAVSEAEGLVGVWVGMWWVLRIGVGHSLYGLVMDLESAMEGLYIDLVHPRSSRFLLGLV